MKQSQLDRRYMDAARSPEERTELLLAQMTLDEKLAQLVGNGVMAGEFHDMQKEIPNGCGHINGSFLLGEENAEDRARSIEKIQRYMVEETRLGIPALFHMEVTSGSFYTDAVVSPVAIGMGATFDPDTVESFADILGRQNRAEGYNHGFGPVMEVGRDQRWGRLGETYGEDPTLVSKMASAFIRGAQGDGDLQSHIATTGKHFLGYGMAEDGLNIGNQRIPDRELQEVHLKPWAAGVEAGLSTVMNSYGVIDQEPIITSHYVLTELLREQLGFKGLVVADYCSVNRVLENYDTVESFADAGAQALMAGLDVELPDPAGFGDGLKQMILDGRVPMARVDDAVRNVLLLKFRMGLFESPYPDYAAIAAIRSDPRNAEVCKKLAQESIVMTKNNGVLPLKSTQKIAVIGPNGNQKRCFYGSYSYTAMLEMKANLAKMFIGMEGMGGAVNAAKENQRKNVFAIGDIEDEIAWRYPEACTLLDAVRKFAPDAVYAQGCTVTGEDRSGFSEALAAAAQADVVILALGGRGGQVDGCTSGEGIEYPEIGLVGVQAQLAQEIAALHKPTILIHQDVRPMADARTDAAVDAILECWYGGTWSADSIANILFGQVSPSGKLPLTCLAGPQQNPLYLGQLRGCGHVNPKTKIQKGNSGNGGPGGKPDDKFQPLYYFGHGLSYTEFSYSGLQLSSGEMDVQGAVAVSLDVTNTGSMTGDEVVQLYFHDDLASMIRPVVELAGFQRVSLAPGETAHITFDFHADQTAFVGRKRTWTVEPGNVHLMIGSSCADIRLNAEVMITGEAVEIVPQRTYYSASSYQVS